MRSPDTDERGGFRWGVAAYGLWGLFPLYFHRLSDVPALQVLAHRIWWSVVVLAAGRWLLRRIAPADSEIQLLVRAAPATARQRRMSALAGCLLAANWGIYVWAVSVDRVVEASLGYYLTPLLTVALGVGVLREQLRPAHRWVLALAGTGVGVLVALTGSVPWVAIGLAISFSLYSLLKKQIGLDAVQSLWLETISLAPFAAAALLLWWWRGSLVTGPGAQIAVLLVLAGVVTAVPLLLFAEAGRRLPLVWIGLLQYITPTIQFLIATAVFHEAMSAGRLVGFGFVWVAVLVMSIDALSSLRMEPTAVAAG